jgi:2-(1,2-epoxy-1,2-dihydrophenyl)acetyl-CoA isomerase
MQTLQFEERDAVGWIRLTRPDKRNPFDAELREELSQVLQRVREEPAIRAVVLAGSPGAFCAGGNLRLLQTQAAAGPAYWQQRIRSGLRTVSDLVHLPRPLIAVVDGPAYGAGFALALTADIVLASPQARFAMSYLRLGLVPDMGALYLLPRMVGVQRAKELMYSTREIGAQEAQRLGLVMEVHPGASIEARAQEIARSLANASPTALALTKAALNASLDGDWQSMCAMEAAAQAAAFSAPEPAIAIAAMLERRAPPFPGFGTAADAAAQASGEAPGAATRDR